MRTPDKEKEQNCQMSKQQFTLEFLQSIDGQIMIAESIQTWGDEEREKAKQDYINILKDKKFESENL